MADLRQQIGSVTLREPVDGRRRRLSAAKRLPGVVLVDSAWQCPECGLRTDDASEHARHMTIEFYAMRDTVRRVRDLIGPESVELEAPIPVGTVALADAMTSAELATLLGVVPRQARRIARERLGAQKVGSTLYVNRDDAVELRRIRQEMSA